MMEIPVSVDEKTHPIGRNDRSGLIIYGVYPESPSYHKKTPVGAASSRDHLISRLPATSSAESEAAPTTNTTCFFKIAGLFNR